MGALRIFTSRFDWVSVFYAGIWLVFLAFPLGYLLEDTSFSGAERLLGCSCFLFFSLIYLLSYGDNTLLPGKAQWQRTLNWSLFLLIPTAFLGLLLGVWVFTFATYFVAMWAFQVQAKIGLTVGICLAIFSTLAIWLGNREVFWQGGFGFALGSVFVLIMAIIVNISERHRENQRLFEKNQLTADIARDVHDILGHSLTVINLKAELAQALVGVDREGAQKEMRQVAELSRTALAEVRATVTRLKSPDLQGELDAAARALETAQIKASLPSGEQVQAAGKNATLFGWVLREAITNVVRHSGASSCWVTFDAERLEVLDNGSHQEIIPGNGLQGLAQRVQEAGGDLILETGNCTRLLVSMNGDTSTMQRIEEQE